MPLKKHRFDDVQVIKINAAADVLKATAFKNGKGAVVYSNRGCFDGCHEPDDVE